MRGQSSQEAAASELPVVLDVWGVLCWIAFGYPVFLSEADIFRRWGGTETGPILRALEARGADAPYCLWEPSCEGDAVGWDGEAWNRIAYTDVAASPNGPRMLRRLVLRLSGQHGRVISFREAAAMLRADMERLERDEQQIEQAKPELMKALRSGSLPIWGKKDLPGRKENPAAQHERIDPAVFLDERVTFTDWDTVGPDLEHPTAHLKYHGPTFRDVKFYTSDVVRLWPPKPKPMATERTLTEWLISFMRTRESPLPKDKTKEAATQARLTFSARGFNRAWAEAVGVTGKMDWSAGGRRKSERRIDTAN